METIRRHAGRLLPQATLVLGIALASSAAAAQTSDWVMPTWSEALATPGPSSILPSSAPAVIPEYETFGDPSGRIASFQPGGATVTADNAFFAALGTNGRTCFSCHQPQDGWALTPATVVSTLVRTQGRDPMFAPVDGADCPTLVADDAGGRVHGPRELAAFVKARRQLFTRANFRIFLPIPADAEWKVRVVRDPYGCETSAKYGIPAGFLSLYRRPLPSANTAALDPQGAFNIMWDAREPNLESQFLDATLTHTQAESPPTAEQIAEGVRFQDGLFTAQVRDRLAGALDGPDVHGGPKFLSTLPPGIPSVLIGQPEWTLFDAWTNPTKGSWWTIAARESIARGQAIFNTKTFTVDGVPGLNDVLGANPVQGRCALCHNNQNRGNDFFLDPKRLGIADNSSSALPPSPDMPLFSFLCKPGTIPYFSHSVVVDGVTYDELRTTDPGLGLITGKCADLGKMKVPILRGLAARAPYFHGGEAASLRELVGFYDRRFSIGLTDEEKHDLISFLDAL